MSQRSAASRTAFAALAGVIVAIGGLAAASGSIAKPVVPPKAFAVPPSGSNLEGIPCSSPTPVTRRVPRAASGRDTIAAEGQCTLSRRIIIDDLGNRYFERMRLCD